MSSSVLPSRLPGDGDDIFSNARTATCIRPAKDPEVFLGKDEVAAGTAVAVLIDACESCAGVGGVIFINVSVVDENGRLNAMSEKDRGMWSTQ